jgi:Carboxypeptidase regulatory-like domain
MFKKLGLLLTLMSLALPAWPASGSGTISGYVRDSSGIPQMGAAVELLPAGLIRPATETLRAFTDARGFYSIARLLPGNYSLKVSAPYFLPTLREKIGLHAGSRLMVNVTMTNLFEAIQLVSLPAQADQDDWKWTLRSISNRPVLRVLEDGTTAVVENGNAGDLKGTLALLAGSPSEGFGSSSDMNAAFSVERSLLSTGTLRLNGDVGYTSDGTTIPSAILRTTYTGRFNPVFEPSFSLTALRLNSFDSSGMAGTPLQAVSLISSDRVVLGDRLEVRLGSELQTIQFLGRVHAFKPFGSADLHLSPNTVLEYQYQSSVPRETLENLSGDRLDPASSDPSSAGPRMSVSNFSPAVERARHQEISLSQRFGSSSMQVAFFSDALADPVLTGIGELSADSGDVLPDIYSGTFSYQGNDFSTRGVRVVLQRKLLSDLTATLDYAYGGVLDLSRPDIQLEDARNFIRTETRHAVAAKFSGTVPKAKTRLVASYRYTGGRPLTSVDLFNTSAGHSDPYFNLFVRQPIPSSLLAGHLELLIDLRNLLAQGYVPVLGQDGHTVYLVQSARSIRGGLAFSF